MHNRVLRGIPDAVGECMWDGLAVLLFDGQKEGKGLNLPQRGSDAPPGRSKHDNLVGVRSKQTTRHNCSPCLLLELVVTLLLPHQVYY